MHGRITSNAQVEEEKLADLAHEHGFTVEELIEEYAIECVVPGICMNQGCSYTSDYEPDQDAGWCEACDTCTVVSALVLAGLI